MRATWGDLEVTHDGEAQTQDFDQELDGHLNEILMPHTAQEQTPFLHLQWAHAASALS
jgi:hypothetical protein